MNAWGITDIGLVRQENQDTFLIERTEGADLIAVVCDGMGGARSGQIASRIAAGVFVRQIHQTVREDMTPSQIQEAMSFCVARANEAVFLRSCEDASCAGMGTTLVAALTAGERVFLCNVGDSRAYRIGGREISCITRDHSVVESLVENGDITAEEARSHPNRNLITRALGPEKETKCDTFQVTLGPNEWVLLCSDGLVTALTDEAIMEAVQNASDAAEAIRSLMSLTIQSGAPDNVTAVLLGNA